MIFLEVKELGSPISYYLICISRDATSQMKKVYSESQKQRVAALWSIPRLEPLKLSEENVEVQFYDIGFQKWILRRDTKCMRSKMKKHNVGEPRKHHARWRKPATKDHILWFHLYGMPRIGQFIETESSGCQGLRKRRVTANRHRVSFWSDENVLELDSGDGCKTLWIY